MGRPKLTETKTQIAARVADKIKLAITALAKAERRTESQTIEMLLEESPKLKAQLQRRRVA